MTHVPVPCYFRMIESNQRSPGCCESPRTPQRSALGASPRRSGIPSGTGYKHNTRRDRRLRRSAYTMLPSDGCRGDHRSSVSKTNTALLGRAGNPAAIFRQFICRKSIQSLGGPAKTGFLWGSARSPRPLARLLWRCRGRGSASLSTKKRPMRFWAKGAFRKVGPTTLTRQVGDFKMACARDRRMAPVGTVGDAGPYGGLLRQKYRRGRCPIRHRGQKRP